MAPTRRLPRSCTANSRSFFPRTQSSTSSPTTTTTSPRPTCRRRHLYREGRLDQRAHRADAAVGDQGAAGTRRRDHRGHGVGHLRPRRSRDVADLQTRRALDQRGLMRRCRDAIHAQRNRPAGRVRIACAATSSTFFRRNRRAKRVAWSCSTRPRSRSCAVRSADGRGDPQAAAVHHLPGVHYVTPQERLIGASITSARSCASGSSSCTRAEQAGRGAAPGAAHHVRPGDDGGGRLLQRHRELLAPPLRARAGRAAAVPVRLPARRPCWSSTNRTQTVPQIGAMYRGDRSRKETLVEFGFRLPSALDNRPLSSRSGSRLAHAGDLRVGHARPVRAAEARRRRWWSRSSARRA